MINVSLKLYSLFYFLLYINYNENIQVIQINKFLSGLIHKSQMSTVRIDDPSEMLAKGEKVFCKVIGMEVSNIVFCYNVYKR